MAHFYWGAGGLVDWKFNICLGYPPKIKTLEQQEACATVKSAPIFVNSSTIKNDKLAGFINHIGYSRFCFNYGDFWTFSLDTDKKPWIKV